MDLRSGHLFWPSHSTDTDQHPPLDQDASCDVAIVGGGLAGAMVAHELTRAGLSCILLDRREPGMGSTAASTALLLYELDTPLHELSRKIGESDAARCLGVGVECIEAFDLLTASLPDRCGFERRPSLQIASDEKDVELLKHEHAARRAAGFDVHLLSRRDLASRYSFSAPAALCSMQAAQVDPFRLTRALLRAARGLRVHGRTHVRTVERAGKGFALGDGAHTVIAGRVVLAAGYEAGGLLRVPGKVVSTFAVATAPLAGFEGWPDRCMIWETARPYLYIRATADGRAIVGGGDEPITDADERDRLIAGKCVELMRRFNGLFPRVGGAPEAAWAGFFVETADGLPFIGESATPGLYLALCFGANGNTFAPAAARIVRELITGGGSGDARLFRLDR